jgi:hypothetical protein
MKSLITSHNPNSPDIRRFHASFPRGRRKGCKEPHNLKRSVEDYTAALAALTADLGKKHPIRVACQVMPKISLEFIVKAFSWLVKRQCGSRRGSEVSL